jgi:solute carrier family 25 S-adenosylmethionine transporter 26
MAEGQVAFAAGAAAAVGSSGVKVPIAVCIRSVQAGVYPNVAVAARAITKAAGPGGLFTGFLPTLLEDVPDMAVKFAVYETLRPVHARLTGGRRPTTAEDLLMGGCAGAAAAAATTPLDVVKTRMMCSASSRPTIRGAVRSVLSDGRGARAFFAGVGPRALSNGLNSAVFFCFFEAIRSALQRRQAEQDHQRLQEEQGGKGGGGKGGGGGGGGGGKEQQQQRRARSSGLAAASIAAAQIALWQQQQAQLRLQEEKHVQQQRRRLRTSSSGSGSSRRQQQEQHQPLVAAADASASARALLSLAVPLLGA